MFAEIGMPEDIHRQVEEGSSTPMVTQHEKDVFM